MLHFVCTACFQILQKIKLSRVRKVSYILLAIHTCLTLWRANIWIACSNKRLCYIFVEVELSTEQTSIICPESIYTLSFIISQQMASVFWKFWSEMQFKSNGTKVYVTSLPDHVTSFPHEQSNNATNTTNNMNTQQNELCLLVKSKVCYLYAVYSLNLYNFSGLSIKW